MNKIKEIGLLVGSICGLLYGLKVLNVFNIEKVLASAKTSK